MPYYVVEIDLKNLTDYAYLKTRPESDTEGDFLSWETGEPLSKQRPVGRFTATTSEQHGSKLRDILPNRFRGIILSERCLSALKSAGVNNLEEFPLSITDQATGDVIDGYRICNLVGHIACVDREASEYEESSLVPGQLEEFDELVLDTDEIDQHNVRRGKRGPLKLFRLSENLHIVIADEDVKKTVADAGLQGWRFTETSRWSG